MAPSKEASLIRDRQESVREAARNVVWEASKLFVCPDHELERHADNLRRVATDLDKINGRIAAARLDMMGVLA